MTYQTAVKIFLILLFIILQGCVGARRSEVAINPKLGHMHKMAENINDLINEGINPESKKTQELTEDEKDALVKKWFNEGYTSWEASGLSGSIAISSSFSDNVYAIYSPIISYFEGKGRIGEAIPYLKEGSAEALENLVIGTYLEWQIKLIDAYNALGQIDLAENEIVNLERIIPEYFDCDFDADLRQYDNLTVFVNIAVHRVRLDFLLKQGRDIEVPLWTKRYKFLKSATQTYPEIRNFEADSRLDGLTFLVGTTMKKYGGDNSYDRMNDKYFFTYAKLFSLNGQNTLAFEALEEVKASYRINIKRLKLIDYYYGAWNGSHNKMNDSTQPYRSRSWLYSKDAEIQLHLDNAQKALDLLQQAKVEFAKVEELYDKLPPFYRLYHKIDFDALELKFLEAKTLEKLGRHQDASDLYRDNITFSEKIRQSLPVEERNQFFRSTAQESYFGLLRCATAQYMDNRSNETFSQVIAAAENFRSRQLREMLQSDDTTDVQNINLTTLRTQLPQKSGALLIVDMVESCLVAFFDGKTHSVHLFAKEAAWDQNIFKLRNRLAENQQFDYAGLREISRQVFTGIEEHLSETDRLYVLSDGALSALPLEIFPIWTNSILADLTTVSYLPSLALLGQSSSSNHDKQLFAVADPVYNAQETIDRHIGRGVMQATRGSSELSMFQALPETRDEVQDILTGFTNKGSMLLGSEAKESNVKTMDLSPYSHIHFATHGVIGGEIPTLTEPALVLSYEDGEDGFLTASEVSKLNLNADMTVLSACNTGNGKYFRGEGLMGIGRAFMVAGSKQVVVSLWPVDSMATKELMVSFYQQMARGLDAPAALAAAKRQYYMTNKQQREVESARGIGRKRIKSSGDTPKRFKQRGNPFFWSPFIVISAEG